MVMIFVNNVDGNAKHVKIIPISALPVNILIKIQINGVTVCAKKELILIGILKNVLVAQYNVKRAKKSMNAKSVNLPMKW